MDMNISNFTSNSSANLTGLIGEIYSGYQLIPFFAFVVPTLLLSLLTIIALVSAKDIDWNMRIILSNVFVSEIINSMTLTTIFWGQPIRAVSGLLDLEVWLYLCSLTVALNVTGNGVKVGTVTLYSILVYVFIRNNIKKVKWYMIAIPLCVMWGVLLVFALSGFIFIPRQDHPEVFVYKGFCPLALSSNGQLFVVAALVQQGINWLLEVFLCGSIIAVFSILIFCYMKKNCSNSDKIKKAVARNLLFLSGGAFLSISNAVLYPTILLLIILRQTSETAGIDARVTTLRVTGYAIDIVSSLTALYSPVVTIILLKPVRDAMKQFVRKCHVCSQAQVTAAEGEIGPAVN